MVEITRVGPSQNPAAKRQRRSRAMQRKGLRSFRVYVPVQQLAEVVRLRKGLTKTSSPTQAQMERAIREGFEVWFENWVSTVRHT
jgi:hypothetical protein